ncbi:lysophospholipid acyltransferase family protein [Kangiella sp. TOML190]|uniref:lysophospholipid acyltransferase family protein n=1 Tax=Kangiella sp. TOML190 TaxID=2931351 RepID=UPI00203A4A9A|nr:lysophospholipid acyltransferase family protein [Kangiella sp. TOML190]
MANGQPQATITEKPKGIAVHLYGILFGFLKLIGRLPYPVVNGLGGMIGKLLYLVKSRRNIVLANLKYCFPELTNDQRLTLCKAHFRSLGIGFIELAVAWYKPFKDLEKYQEVRGLEHYQKAQASGQGILFLGYHITSLELAGAVMSRHLDFAAFYRPNKNASLNYHIQKGRNNRSQTLGRNDIRTIGKWLKSGHNLWFMPDQDMGRKSTVFAPFYGKPAATLNSPMRIAKLGNAQVLPISYHKEHGKMILEVMPPIEFSGDDLADCSLMNQVLESCINKAPEQYYWVHRRFKTRPEGEASIY